MPEGQGGGERLHLGAWHRRLVLEGAKSPAETLLLTLLLPFGWLYGLIGRLRVFCYRCGILPSYRAAIPVISVGNLAVGGTGKTPVVDLLLNIFVGQGLRPAVVSRGYGGRFKGEVGVVCRGEGPEMLPELCGDEPYLLAKRNPQVAVYVARKRVLGVQAAETAGADIIILDDGFQHLGVARDIDLVLLDARAPFGNGQPLPAGLLREFRSALSRADLVLLTRCDKQGSRAAAFPTAWRSVHRLADYAIDLAGDRVALDALRGKRLAAFAGIADPDNFFNALEKQGLSLSARVALGDHVSYTPETLNEVTQRTGEVDYLLTTEKDGVKLKTDLFEVPCLQVPVSVELEKPAEFSTRLLSMLEGVNRTMKKDLLEILACPKCKGKVQLQDETGGIRCESCRLEYPVRDDIPVMLIDEAESF